MKFFIPAAEDKAKEDQIYSAIKKFVTKELEAIPSSRKIFKLVHRHDGKEYLAEVGKVHPLSGETVIAILFAGNRNLYYICTPNRGVIRGMPILCGAAQVTSFEDFEQ